MEDACHGIDAMYHADSIMDAEKQYFRAVGTIFSNDWNPSEPSHRNNGFNEKIQL